MIKGTTKSGFKYEIKKNRLDNYELVEQLSELETNPFMLTKIVIGILGAEQTNQLKDHLRDEDGIVPATRMEQEVTEILNAHNETKNS